MRGLGRIGGVVASAGGLGGVVAESLATDQLAPVFRMGVHDRYGQSGTVEELWQEYELDCASIVKKVIEISTKESKK